MRPHTRKIKHDPLDNLWKLFEEWAEDYAKVNGVDKEEVINSIAERHKQLSRKLHELKVTDHSIRKSTSLKVNLG